MSSSLRDEPTCPSCGGDGYHIELAGYEHDGTAITDKRKCDDCDGSGAEVVPEPRGWALLLASEEDTERVRSYRDEERAGQDETATYDLYEYQAAVARARLVRLDAPADAGAVTFAEAWAEKERAGYQYGADALEQVRFGWDICMATRNPIHDADAIRDEAHAAGKREGRAEALREALALAESQTQADAVAALVRAMLADAEKEQRDGTD